MLPKIIKPSVTRNQTMCSFTIALVLFYSCINAKAENVKFIQATDVHLTKDNTLYLEDFVNEINKNYNDLDFVIFTGDNIDKPKIEDLQTFLGIIKKLKVKKYVILGNHDVYKSGGLNKQLYMKTVRKNLGAYHSDSSNYIFKIKGVVFIVMDGVKEVIPGSAGFYKESELQWLDSQLTKYKNKKVVVFQHFPLLDSKRVTHNLYKKENYLQVLNKHNNVIAIISGHYHKNREEFDGSIYHIVTEKFSDNTNYKIIEIDTEIPMVYSRLISKDENKNNLE